jgi:multidrug resistance protein, MATE family
LKIPIFAVVFSFNKAKKALLKLKTELPTTNYCYLKDLSTTFRDIIRMATPLIIGSLGHNIISMTDTIVLGRYGAQHEVEYAAIGLMAPAYLLITMIGLAISRGGQILIARRVGEGRSRYVGRITQNMLYFELAMATTFFVIVWLFGYRMLASVIDEQSLLDACWNFLTYRIWGIYFTFIGATAIAFYSGIGRTKIILVNAGVLAAVNVLLNYALVFGMFGLPELGIRGSALASVIAEGLGMVVFIIYLYRDTANRKYHLFYLPPIDWDLIKMQFRLSTPIALQSLFGMGSWLLFFTFVENYGIHDLAVSNAVRVLYLFLGVPTWGMSNATTTIVSNLIGQNKRSEVFLTLCKITLLNLGLTLVLSIWLLIAPAFLLSITTTNVSVIHDAIDLLHLLFPILLCIAAANIFYNGIVGSGAIGISLLLQIVAVVAYVAYAYVVMEQLHLPLLIGWCAEFVYFVIILVFSVLYMRGSRWHSVDI